MSSYKSINRNHPTNIQKKRNPNTTVPVHLFQIMKKTTGLESLNNTVFDKRNNGKFIIRHLGSGTVIVITVPPRTSNKKADKSQQKIQNDRCFGSDTSWFWALALADTNREAMKVKKLNFLLISLLITSNFYRKKKHKHYLCLITYCIFYIPCLKMLLKR